MSKLSINCRNFVAKSAIWFSENEGGSKAVWNFSENSSFLIPSPVPYTSIPTGSDPVYRIEAFPPENGQVRLCTLEIIEVTISNNMELIGTTFTLLRTWVWKILYAKNWLHDYLLDPLTSGSAWPSLPASWDSDEKQFKKLTGPLLWRSNGCSIWGRLLLCWDWPPQNGHEGHYFCTTLVILLFLMIANKNDL